MGGRKPKDQFGSRKLLSTAPLACQMFKYEILTASQKYLKPRGMSVWCGFLNRELPFIGFSDLL